MKRRIGMAVVAGLAAALGIVTPGAAFAADCATTASCLAECGDDEACISECVNGADTADDAQNAANVLACQKENAEECEGVAECLAAVCAAQYEACGMSEPMGGDADCETTVSCLAECGESADCAATCNSSATSEDVAKAAADALLCQTNASASCSTAEKPETCIAETCAKEFELCGIEMPSTEEGGETPEEEGGEGNPPLTEGDPCPEGLDYAGYCGTDGAVYWCENDVVNKIDCAAGGNECAFNEEAGYYDCAQQGGEEGGGDCGEIDVVGICEGTVLKYCENGELIVGDCAEQGDICGFDEANQWYDCLSPEGEEEGGGPGDPCPAGLTATPECDGDTLRWCQDDKLATQNCASAGMVCGIFEETGEYDCIDPSSGEDEEEGGNTGESGEAGEAGEGSAGEGSAGEAGEGGAGEGAGGTDEGGSAADGGGEDGDGGGGCNTSPLSPEGSSASLLLALMGVAIARRRRCLK